MKTLLHIALISATSTVAYTQPSTNHQQSTFSHQLASTHAFWSDAFHPEFSKPAQTKALIDDLRSFNCNALFAQVRKRGDAWYNSKFEPKAEGIDNAYDPLADLIARAHDTNAGPRIEIHAWVNSYLIWRRADGTPIQSNHPYLLHRDWLDQSNDGTLQDGGEFGFDPGHLLPASANQLRITSDATGFYGAANIPPGEYTLISSSTTNTCTIHPGKVTTVNLSGP